MLARSNEKLLAKILQDEDRLKKVSTLWRLKPTKTKTSQNLGPKRGKTTTAEQKNRAVSLENIRKQKEQQERNYPAIN